jgi:hypothetical protein
LKTYLRATDSKYGAEKNMHGNTETILNFAMFIPRIAELSP